MVNARMNSLATSNPATKRDRMSGGHRTLSILY